MESVFSIRAELSAHITNIFHYYCWSHCSNKFNFIDLGFSSLLWSILCYISCCMWFLFEHIHLHLLLCYHIELLFSYICYLLSQLPLLSVLLSILLLSIASVCYFVFYNIFVTSHHICCVDCVSLMHIWFALSFVILVASDLLV